MFHPRYREMTGATLSSFKKAEKLYTASLTKKQSQQKPRQSKLYTESQQIDFDFYYNNLSAQLLRSSKSPGFSLSRCNEDQQNLSINFDNQSDQKLSIKKIDSRDSEDSTHHAPEMIESGAEFYSHLEPGLIEDEESDEFDVKNTNSEQVLQE